jgi:hypothetical protein
VGRLCGADDRVLERVVTYLVSAVECVRNMRRNVCFAFVQDRMARADDARSIASQMIEANKERRRLLASRSVRLSVFGNPVEDEGDTVFGLVVNDFRHLIG